MELWRYGATRLAKLVYPAKNSPPDCFLNALFDSHLHKEKEKPRLKAQLLFLERVMGIEPTRPAWKAGILAIELHPHLNKGYNITFLLISQEFFNIIENYFDNFYNFITFINSQ